MFGGLGLEAVIVYGSLAWVPSYLIRNFASDAAFVGAGLSIVMLAGAFIGFPAIGWLVDRFQAAGNRDVHFRTFVLCTAVMTVLGCVSFALVRSAVLLLVLLALLQVVQPLSGVAIAHIQLTTPAHFRARTVALLTTAINLLGMSIGPTTVALLSDKVLGGPQHLGGAITLTFAIYCVPAIAGFALARGGARRACAANAGSERRTSS